MNGHFCGAQVKLCVFDSRFNDILHTGVSEEKLI